jgi:hypothetical protein
MTRTFLRHYLEMLLAMFIGMGVLAGGLAAAGVDIRSVELALLWMAFSMSLPMVAWMRYRGHGWTPSMEMAAAMFLPSFAAIALLSTAGAASRSAGDQSSVGAGGGGNFFSNGGSLKLDVYLDAPGTVVRFRSCHAAVLRVVETPHRTWVDLRGARSWSPPLWPGSGARRRRRAPRPSVRRDQSPR